MVNKELLKAGAQDFSLHLTDGMLEKFERYAQQLVDYNKMVNLTAITDPDGIAVKHFVDSIAPLSFVTLPEGARVADVGCGAGFPSVPMAIVRPDLSLSLIDGLNKRLVFLDGLTASLSVQAETFHLRGEEAGRRAEHRDSYDVVCARAVAKLRTLCEYCMPLVKPGGMFLALKGPEAEAELHEAAGAIAHLSGRAQPLLRYTLSDNSERTLILIEKISQTSTKYPRISAKIAKSPL